jgi:hypothetical protein
MNRKECEMIGNQIEVLLQNRFPAYQVSYTKGSFGTNGAKFTVEVKDAKADFASKAEMYGLKPEFLGKPFKSKGKDFTVYGINTQARKYSVLAKTKTGEVYGFTPKAIIDHLKFDDIEYIKALRYIDSLGKGESNLGKEN